jgi:hypothetical protein
MRTLKSRRSFFAVALPTALIALLAGAPRAQAEDAIGSSSSGSVGAAVEDYFANWFLRVASIQSEQPQWVSPPVTSTARLKEEFRYDQYWQALPHGKAIDNFGAGKGLALIPWENLEVILGIPAWIAYNGAIQHPKAKEKPPSDGWADETFLIKYRLLSANEEDGNYVVTTFMGFSAPTGDDGSSSRHGVFTPTIAFGKGWGDFVIQGTAGIALPDGGLQRLGMPVAWNTAFQYQFFKFLWPDFEVNYTWWPNGEREGQTQAFLTPGLVVGRFPIHNRIDLTLGAGYQVAVTNHPAYNHSVVLTARIPF